MSRSELPTSQEDRQILHVDMDAFFVSVELLDRPDLVGRPVVVGGSGPRGVIAAASYEARHFGVGSAMASVTARRLCPEAVFLDGRHSHYSAISKVVMGVFEEFTPLIEPLSLDEAFLDVSGAIRLLGPAPEIARSLRQAVFDRTGLWCSVGVAPNKFLAKLASVQAKPKASLGGPIRGSGVFVVEPDRISEFLEPLPIRALWGVGRVTGEKLHRLGVSTVKDIVALSEQDLISALGKSVGSHLFLLAKGIDDRPVVTGSQMKSISHEETFPADISDRAKLESRLVAMSEAVATRMRAQKTTGRTVTLKVRFPDFQIISRSKTSKASFDDGRHISAAAREMLNEIEVSGGVRLLGVGVTKLGDAQPEQLGLFSERNDGTEDFGSGEGPQSASEHRREINSTVDQIRDRFGSESIGLARLVEGGRIAEFKKGEKQWGPTESHESDSVR